LSPIRVSQHVSVGDAPEGVSFSPDGNLAAATILQGSYDAPRGAWWRHDAGLVSLLLIDGNDVKLAQSAAVEAFPEGVAFSKDGRFLYVGNFADSSLSILPVDKSGVLSVGRVLKLAGPPAALRIGSR
jgi:DNA-binding beta-propeller fold protein YncE